MNLQDVLSQLAEARQVEAEAAGIDSVETDTKVAQAAIHLGATRAYQNASELATGDEQASLHDFETIDTEKLLSHPERELYSARFDSRHRDVLEDAPWVEEISTLDDQTIEVTMIVGLPSEL